MYHGRSKLISGCCLCELDPMTLYKQQFDKLTELSGTTACSIRRCFGILSVLNVSYKAEIRNIWSVHTSVYFI